MKLFIFPEKEFPTKIMNITPFSEEKLKINKHKTHSCVMSHVKTDQKFDPKSQGTCTFRRPANLPYKDLKLHYITHYLYRGTWNNIIPEEMDDQKIESYTCNIQTEDSCKQPIRNIGCDGRKSALVHLAMFHGLLLKAMLNDNKVDTQTMHQEIKDLAHYDVRFNQAYKNFIGNKIYIFRIQKIF